MANVKFLTGSKERVDEQLTSGRADAGDIILTSDTDEMIFVNPQTEKRIIKSRTQNSYTLNGVDLGTLKDGSVIEEGIDIDDLLKLITNKAIPVAYTAPELIFASGNEMFYEVGENIQTSLQSQFIQNDAGALTAHSIIKNGVEIHNDTSAVSSMGVSFTASDEEVSFESKAIYQPGEIKSNNLGEEVPEGAIPAGELTSKPIVFKGYRKLFFSTGNEELLEMNSDNIRACKSVLLTPEHATEFIIDMLAGEQYIMFAYPASFNDAKITYIQMNDDEMASSFTQEIVPVQGANGYDAIDYKVYSYKTDMPIASKASFKVEF